MRLLGLLVDGQSYKTAATELGVSSNTICVHIENGYIKLQVPFEIRSCPGRRFATPVTN